MTRRDLKLAIAAVALFLQASTAGAFCLKYGSPIYNQLCFTSTGNGNYTVEFVSRSFPQFKETRKQIYQGPIKSIYFNGKSNDPEAQKLIQRIPADNYDYNATYHLIVIHNLGHDIPVQNDGNILRRDPNATAAENVAAEQAQQERLKEFVPTMQSEIIGQDQLINGLYEGALGHLPGNKPLAYFLFGGKGTGKSATAEAFALARYGDRSLVETFDLGKVQADERMNPLSGFLGPQKPWLGSDKESQFEIALKRMPHGGVFNFEEASNLGKGNMQQKAEAFKAFLSMLETGKWHSDFSNKTYDLSNYTFLFNGNDGQKLLAGTRSEDQRLKIWKENSAPNKTKEILKNAGIPEEFLDRLDGIYFQKPISLSEALTIATTRFLKPTLEKIAARYPRLKIQFEDGFLGKLVSLAFNQSDGVRKLRTLIQTKVVSTIVRLTHEIPSEEEQTIHLALNDSEKTTPDENPFDRKITIVASAENGKSITTDVTPEIPLDRLLGLDSEYPADHATLGKVLDQAHGRLSSQVIGQPEAINEIHEAMVGHFMNPGNNSKPVSFFNIGPTGVGKSELPKQVARAYFGDASKSEVLSLGTIADPHSLELFFGRGSAGQGNKIPPFEEALRKLGGSGVLILDEASNMGSGNKQFKEAMFKQFYDLLEEGSYHSEVTGITYDLSNIVFWFNGNDGEKIFPPGGSEQMMEKIWKENNSPEKVHQILIDAGIPPAFLGRIDALLLSRSLTKGDNIQIGKVKFLDPAIASFEKTNRATVTYDDDFTRQLSKSFFSSLQGARSLKKVVAKSVNAALGLAMYQGKKDLGTNKGLTLHMTLKDSDTLKPYALENEPPRTVVLEIKITAPDGKSTTYTKDVTRAAPVIPKPTRNMLKGVTLHEAGHIEANRQEETGMFTDYVTVWRSKMPNGATALGYASFQPVNKGEENGPATRKGAIARIARSMGGQLGQMMGGYDSSEGWQDDLRQIRNELTRHLIKSGMVEGLTGIAVDKDEAPKLSGEQQIIFDREANKMLHEAFLQAQVDIMKNWGALEAISERILEKGDIHEDEIRHLQETAPPSTGYKTVTEAQFFGRYLTDEGAVGAEASASQNVGGVINPRFNCFLDNFLKKK